MFNNQDAVNRKMMWTDPVMKFIGISTGGRRIVGIAADLDDENIVPGPKMTVYHPMEQEFGGGRLFVHAKVDPYTLVTPITKIIRDISAEQPVERAATLEDVRAEVLAPNRLNTLVFGGFALVALTIAVVGVAGVLAFSVSARMREFGVRLAIGSTPSNLLTRILGEGAVIAGAGIVTGVIAGLALLRFAGGFFGNIEVPGVAPLAGAAAVLDRRGRDRLADAGDARLARRRDGGAALGIARQWCKGSRLVLGISKPLNRFGSTPERLNVELLEPVFDKLLKTYLDLRVVCSRGFSADFACELSLHTRQSYLQNCRRRGKPSARSSARSMLCSGAKVGSMLRSVRGDRRMTGSVLSRSRLNARTLERPAPC